MQTDTLYILVRVDMESQGFGKACAQAAHAANQFTNDHLIKPLLSGKEPDPDVLEWTQQANGFGTTFTLAAPSLQAMQDTIDAAEMLGFKAGIVVDPTYPFLIPNEMIGRMDQSKMTLPAMTGPPGKTLCFTSEITTAYVFGDKAQLAVLLARYQPLSNDPIPVR